MAGLKDIPEAAMQSNQWQKSVMFYLFLTIPLSGVVVSSVPVVVVVELSSSILVVVSLLLSFSEDPALLIKIEAICCPQVRRIIFES